MVSFTRYLFFRYYIDKNTVAIIIRYSSKNNVRNQKKNVENLVPDFNANVSNVQPVIKIPIPKITFSKIKLFGV